MPHVEGPLNGDRWLLVRSLRLAALADAPRALDGSYDEEASWTEREWRHFVAGQMVFVLFNHELPSGVVLIAPESDDDVAVMSGCWIAPEVRRRGLLRELFTALDADHRFSWNHYELEVWEDNSAAIAAYNRLGFTPSGLRGSTPEPLSRGWVQLLRERPRLGQGRY